MENIIKFICPICGREANYVDNTGRYCFRHINLPTWLKETISEERGKLQERLKDRPIISYEQFVEDLDNDYFGNE